MVYRKRYSTRSVRLHDDRTPRKARVRVRTERGAESDVRSVRRARARRVADSTLRSKSDRRHDPADAVHDEVVAVMDEVGIDVSNRTPREVSTETLESCDVVATMGCSTLELDAERVEIRDWNLDDPHGQDIERVRDIRDAIENRFISFRTETCVQKR